MARKGLFITFLAATVWLGLPAKADTFKNKQTGETFYGFRTQKSTANKTLVYDDSTKKLMPLDLRDYEITMDDNGRRNSVVVVPITDAEILLSETVAKTVADAVVKASNTGPRFVLLKIDNPGGRGEYMKELCSAISKTDNCKVVAYIPGGSFGGAHSAAAILALACSKIYIAPLASMAAVGPFVGASGKDFVRMYSPDNLALFSVFAATLAEAHQRPILLARAFLDKKISLVEVIDTDGKKTIVEKDSRQPTQTIIKTICEGLSEPLEQPAASADKQIAIIISIPPDIHNRVLNLTPGEAVRLKLADKIADSIQEVLADMNAADAQIANAPGIDTVVRQFTAAQKNIRQRLAKIEYLEGRTAILEQQLKVAGQQIQTTLTTRTQTPNMSSNPDNKVRDTRNRNKVGRISKSETTTSTESSAAVEQIKTELCDDVLPKLIAEYRQTIPTAKRWPGALPAEITVQTLEKNMNSAMVLAENICRRP
jgi:membrane-bound ClpP family serine protease